MGFFGVFGEGRERAWVADRAAYLCMPVLHFSLDGRLSLAYGKWDDEMSANAYPHLFAATAAKSGRISLSPQTLSRLYHRYGKGFYKHLPRPAAFALYDSRRSTLYLGGTGGERCYVEAEGNAVFFSSDPSLLRAPVAVELARFASK